MWKFFTGTPWGTTPPGKGGHHPEASLGESPEMAASSVGSGHKSCVMEPRNMRIAGAFAFMPAGAAPERPTRPGARVRPGSKSRADVRKGSLGTWDSLRTPLRIGQTKGDTGIPTSRHSRGRLAAGVSERAKHEGVSRAERNEARETDQSSRSVFIVAPESRETGPRKPVSSQGRRRFTDPSRGHTR